jgi:acyl carrier protein
MDFASFRTIAIDFLRAGDATKARAFAAISGDEDLLACGLVDSHRFIELCLALEERTGQVIDLAELEPEQFSSLSGLYAVVSAQAPA